SNGPQEDGQRPSGAAGCLVSREYRRADRKVPAKMANGTAKGSRRHVVQERNAIEFSGTCRMCREVVENCATLAAARSVARECDRREPAVDNAVLVKIVYCASKYRSGVAAQVDIDKRRVRSIVEDGAPAV